MFPSLNISIVHVVGLAALEFSPLSDVRSKVASGTLYLPSQLDIGHERARIVSDGTGEVEIDGETEKEGGGGGRGRRRRVESGKAGREGGRRDKSEGDGEGGG